MRHWGGRWCWGVRRGGSHCPLSPQHRRPRLALTLCISRARERACPSRQGPYNRDVLVLRLWPGWRGSRLLGGLFLPSPWK